MERSRKVVRASLLGAVVLFCSTPAQAAVDLDQPFTIAYKLSRWGLTLGEAQFSLADLGNDCHLYRGVAIPRGLAALLVGRVYGQSRYCVVDGLIQPQRFEYIEAGDPKDNYALDFDWRAGTVRLANGESRPLPRRSYDQLSLQLGIRRMIMQRGGNRPELPLALTVVEDDRIRDYRFQVVGRERLETPLGAFDTLRVERTDHSSKKLRFWLAPGLSYMPVRIELQEDDTAAFLLTLETWSGEPK